MFASSFGNQTMNGSMSYISGDNSAQMHSLFSKFMQIVQIQEQAINRLKDQGKVQEQEEMESCFYTVNVLSSKLQQLQFYDLDIQLTVKVFTNTDQ